MKVQFGSGSNILPDWVNHDSDVDITKKLPYADISVHDILCEHCCEHISTPDFLRFLDECNRVLVHSGRLWLSLPVLERLDVNHARDIILGHGHLAAYTTESLWFVMRTAKFRSVSHLSNRPEIFGHWKAIGSDKDGIESARFLLVK